MTRLDVLQLGLLGAIWGASFLFMRVAAPAFGPIALIEVRVAVAALFLVAWVAWRGRLADLRGRGKELAFLGVINSALPFTLFAYATLSLTAGLSSVLNATAPLFGALVAFVWLRQSLGWTKASGILVGFLGVILLVSHKLDGSADRSAILAALLAATCYGFAAHYIKRRFTLVDPLVVAAGSQVGAALAWLVPALLRWPRAAPPPSHWACALALGVVCTGVANVLYFQLIARIGPTRAIVVTYLIPVFGMLWGRVFLGEPITLRMLLGCAVVLTGTTIVVRSRPAAETAAPFESGAG